MSSCIAGFNGERVDPISGTIGLGNGYRAYSPALRRFNRPDSMSPFGAGGINSYAYCIGDPVNRADPSGHLSGMGLAGIVMGALGILMAPFTAGQSLTVMSSLTAGLEAISGATAIATGVLEESSPQTSSALGWVSLATGMLSLGAGLVRGARRFTDSAARLIGRFQRVNGKIGIPLSGEFRNARFLGANRGTGGITWNMRFEDEVPLGRRLTIVSSGNWNNDVLHAMNDTVVNGNWRQQTYSASNLREAALDPAEDFSVYRLAIFDSGINQRTAGRSFAGLFRLKLITPRPVIGFRGLPVTAGPVADSLVRTYETLNDLERNGYGHLWGPISAQQVLDGLSQQYANTESAITFSSNAIVFPSSERSYQNVSNWQ